MNRASIGTRVVVPREERALSEALTLHAAFLLDQPSPRRPSSALSRSRAYACAVPSNSWPHPRGPSQSERLPATHCYCTLYHQPPAHTNQPCTGRTKNLGTPHHRAAHSPRLTSIPQTPIVASSNLLNVWDMLESCKSVGHGFLSWEVSIFPIRCRK